MTYLQLSGILEAEGRYGRTPIPITIVFQSQSDPLLLMILSRWQADANARLASGEAGEMLV